MVARLNLVGKRFGRLLVVSFAGMDHARKVRELVESGLSQAKAAEIAGVSKMAASRMIRNIS